ALLLAAFITSCVPTVSVRPGYIKDDKEATSKAIDRFHSQMNSGQIDQMYETSADFLRSTHSRNELSQAIGQVTNRIGKFERITYSEIRVKIGAPIEIRAVCSSIFEKGDATELFIFLKETKDVQLASYQILDGSIAPGSLTSPPGAAAAGDR